MEHFLRSQSEHRLHGFVDGLIGDGIGHVDEGVDLGNVLGGDVGEILLVDLRLKIREI